MSTLTLYATDLSLILCLYALKLALFRFVRTEVVLLGAFFLGVALAVPVTWWTSPDWINQCVYPISNWIGAPVAVLTVPCLSFLADFVTKHRSMRYWQVRVPCEVLVFAPLWLMAWVQIEHHVLGWVSDEIVR